MPNAPRIFGQRSKPAPRKAWQRSGRYKRTLVGDRLQKTKRRILERDDFKCCECGKMVEYEDSTLDHVVPISREGTDDDDNLQTLCRACDKIKTRRESRQEERPVGWRPGMLHIICGPPGSGKTTYVQEHKAKGDIVFDFDTIAQALGAEMYNHGQHLIEPIESIRRLLIKHASQTEYATWIIVTDLKRATETARRYDGQLKIMDTPPEACIRRLRHDGRPRIDDRIARVRAWWSEYETLVK